MNRDLPGRMSRRSFLAGVMTAGAAALVGQADGGRTAASAFAAPATVAAR
jgi:hypothetical protein